MRPTPWRAFLDRNGPGVFHVCLRVDDRRAVQRDRSDINVGMPYHAGCWPGSSYWYVDAAQQLSLELSINYGADVSTLMQDLYSGQVLVLEELKAP